MISPSSLRSTPAPLRPALALLALLLFSIVTVPAQDRSVPASGSSSSSDSPTRQESSSTARVAQQQAASSAVTLETSEPLFDLAVALNSCGYNNDLASSLPLRTEVRSQVATLVAASPSAAQARDAVCGYMRSHTLADPARNLAQYVSLALFLNPDLLPSADETELPPDSTQIVNILPLLRTFVEQAHLHAVWIERRPEYTALVDKMHGPLTRMILETNVYLRTPVSSYEGRRFLVLVEPMLAPSEVNARIYGTNYSIVVSPSTAGTFHMEQIRHTYLHYEVEPMVYARATAMDRLLPLLKNVQDAPIEFSYKSDIVSLITECLIKAIEARTMDTGLQKPQKPTNVHQRSELEQYDTALNVYDRQVEAARRNAAELSTRHGWILTNYFYDELIHEEHSNISLQENIGQMVYGMDVDRQAHIARQISFIPDTSNQEARRVAAPPTGLRLAEVRLMQGHADEAHALAEKALADPNGDHSEANYILARIALLQKQPDSAQTHFQAALADAHDPQTAAWSHIYLGRLYDVQPDRRRAVAEYRAALAALDSLPPTGPATLADPRAAANAGLKTPFALPRQDAQTASSDSKGSHEDDDDAPIDPSGKSEKDSYRPAPRP